MNFCKNQLNNTYWQVSVENTCSLIIFFLIGKYWCDYEASYLFAISIIINISAKSQIFKDGIRKLNFSFLEDFSGYA